MISRYIYSWNTKCRVPAPSVAIICSDQYNGKENHCPAFPPAHQLPFIQVLIYIPVAESIEPKPCILENHVPSCSFTAILALDSGTNHCQPGTPVQAEAAPAKRTPDVLHFGYGACIDDEVNASLVVPRLETERNKLIILETNISPSKALFKMIFLSPCGIRDRSQEGITSLKSFKLPHTFPSSNSIGSSLFLETAGFSEDCAELTSTDLTPFN